LRHAGLSYYFSLDQCPFRPPNGRVQGYTPRRSLSLHDEHNWQNQHLPSPPTASPEMLRLSSSEFFLFLWHSCGVLPIRAKDGPSFNNKPITSHFILFPIPWKGSLRRSRVITCRILSPPYCYIAFSLSRRSFLSSLRDYKNLLSTTTFAYKWSPFQFSFALRHRPSQIFIPNFF